MKYIEIYTREDGHSDFKEIEMPIKSAFELGAYSHPISVKNIMFRSSHAGQNFPQHNAPQRQFIFYRSGEVEIEASCGKTYTFRAGDILLAADTTGYGHISRIVQDSEAVIIEVSDA